MRYVILLLLTATGYASIGQTNTLLDTLMPVTRWHRAPVPSTSQTSQYARDSAWCVYLKAGELYVNRGQAMLTRSSLPFKNKDSVENLPGKLTIQPVQNGMLVGIDRGEQEGGVYWMSFTRDRKYLVSLGNNRQFKRSGTRIFLLQATDSTSGYLKRLFLKTGNGSQMTLRGCPILPIVWTLTPKVILS